MTFVEGWYQYWLIVKTISKMQKKLEQIVEQKVGQKLVLESAQ